MTDPIRARLDRLWDDVDGDPAFAALRAVLDEMDATDNMGWSAGNEELAYVIKHIRSVIAEHLGVTDA